MNDENLKTAEQDIAALRTLMHGIISNEKIAKILGKDFSRELCDWEKLIEKRCNEPFTLVILGEFKRGKSTIINALLGKDIAPINVTPETYTINEITYGPYESVEAILENGMKVPMTLEAITREQLERRMKIFPSKVDHIKIKENIMMLKNMRIVDTPGLSDLESLDRQVEDYIVNADAIMYACSCLMPFSETEQFFLMKHIHPQRFGMLYILVNMLDALNTQKDVDKIMKRFKGISERIVPNAFLYGISGSDELARKLGQKRPADKGTREFYETQFMQFELSLKRDIIMQKDVIRTKRVLTMLNQMYRETESKLSIISDMAELDKYKLAQRSEEFEEQCKKLEKALEEKKPAIHLSVMEMQQEAESWMYEFFAKLRSNILDCRAKDADGEDIYNPDDIEKYFYSFLMEKMGEAYRTCIETHRDQLSELVDQISRELAVALGIEDASKQIKTPSVERIMLSVNKNVTRSVMGVKLFGTSEMFPPAAMSSFNLLLKKKKTTDIIDITLENYDDIRNNVIKDIKNVYQDLEVKAISRLDSLYQYQVDMGREALNQAQEVLSGYDDDEIHSALNEARELLKEPKMILDKYGLENE